jgi:3-dehydroquinate synthase
MVDSSVGGKTGVDHPRGKNLIGAFHQPRVVIADLDFLGTLPRREAVSGFAEVIKAALLGDPVLFDAIEKRGPEVLEQPVELEEAIGRAVALKAHMVERDETEAGPRALLNLGHTLGHAVEVAAGYGTVSHGEAVAFGMAFAARLSAKLGLLGVGEQDRILKLLGNWGYPLRVEGVSSEKILEALRHDKKSREGTPRWVVLRGIGEAEWGREVPAAEIRTLLEEVQESP